MDKKLKVAVVGAGPAGACAAYYLAKEGYDVCVYDKEKKPGGRTLGYEDERIRLDTGAGHCANVSRASCTQTINIDGWHFSNVVLNHVIIVY